MSQYNFIILIGAYLIYLITICVKKKISILSTFYTLLFGAAVYFSISLGEGKGKEIEGLLSVISIAMFISLLFTIIFVRSLYEYNIKKEKFEPVKPKVQETFEEVVKPKKEKKSKVKKEKEHKEELEAIIEEVDQKVLEVPVVEVKEEVKVEVKKEEPQFEEIPLVEEEKSVEENNDTLEEGPREVTLKESIQLAKKQTGKLEINKQVVYDYIAKYADVEVNNRKNMTATGLPLADTHYRLTNTGKVCFIYVYEIEGSSFMILRLPEKDNASKFIKKYGLAKSAFPKQPFDWYTVILSSKFKSNEEVFELIDEAYNEVY